MGACFLSLARADFMTPHGYTDIPEEERERTPGLQIFLAFIFTVLAMVIVCMPARKRTAS
jgi:hypothetical protein